MTLTVLHILPQDGIGGAEIAAHSAAKSNPNIHLLFLTSNDDSSQISHDPNVHYAPAANPFSWRSLRFGLSLYRQLNPNITVFSLWKCLPMLLLLRLLHPRMNAALLLHSAQHVHLLDLVSNSVMQLLVSRVWCDSNSAAQRVFRIKRSTLRIISFLVRKPKPVVSPDPRPHFIYWGRLSPVKNLAQVCRFFQSIRNTHTTAKLTLVGPDGGELAALKSLSIDLGIKDAVNFAGEKSWDQICALATDHSFYIQFSHFEGMAMSVTEAMQLGLVPIVTPVGEIAAYGEDMQNCIFYDDPAKTLAAVEHALSDTKTFQRLSQNAQSYWANQDTYAADFFAACQEQARANK